MTSPDTHPEAKTSATPRPPFHRGTRDLAVRLANVMASSATMVASIGPDGSWTNQVPAAPPGKAVCGCNACP